MLNAFSINSAHTESLVLFSCSYTHTHTIVCENKHSRNTPKDPRSFTHLYPESNNVDPLVSGFGQIYFTVKYI
jgi:hypothetical protein